MPMLGPADSVIPIGLLPTGITHRMTPLVSTRPPSVPCFSLAQATVCFTGCEDGAAKRLFSVYSLSEIGVLPGSFVGHTPVNLCPFNIPDDLISFVVLGFRGNQADYKKEGEQETSRYKGLVYEAKIKDSAKREEFAIMQSVSGFELSVYRKDRFEARIWDFTDDWYADLEIPYKIRPPERGKEDLIVSGDMPKVTVTPDPRNYSEKVGLFRSAVVKKADLSSPILAVSWYYQQRLSIDDRGRVDMDRSFALLKPILYSNLYHKDPLFEAHGTPVPYKMVVDASKLLQGLADRREQRITDEDRFNDTVKRLKDALSKKVEEEAKLTPPPPPPPVPPPRPKYPIPPGEGPVPTKPIQFYFEHWPQSERERYREWLERAPGWVG
jgi:hypothetical protein